MSNKGVFSGIRVVETAIGIAGPYATRFLADQGADVIKLESEEGDPYRTDPGFHAINRNKRSVVTDNAESLIASADVLVVRDETEADHFRLIAPGAVIVSFPVWGSSGLMATHSGTPSQVAAMTGIGWNQLSYSEGPVHVVMPVAAYGAGMLGALAIAAGLYAREAHGSAPTYEVSDVAGSGAMQIGDCWSPSTPQQRDGASPLGATGRLPAYRLFETKDKKWLFVACGTAVFFKSLLKAIGRQDLDGDPRLPSPPWGLIEDEPLGFITPILESAFASADISVWIELLRAHDVPCQPVQTREEFLASALAQKNDLFVEVLDSKVGSIQMPSQPLVFDKRPSSEARPAPLLGEHTSLVAKETHIPGAGVGQGGAPLSGLRAIDLSSFIAGPVITRHLGMLGAEIIKVEPPSGDSFRTFGPMFNGWNQSKKGVILDLKTDEDQKRLHNLVKTADLVVENFRPGVAEKLGCSEEKLRQEQPNLVLVKSPGYGADEEMAKIPAFDPLLQALGGVMAAQGGFEDPVFLSVPVHDAATPLIAAFGVIAAWFHRSRTEEILTVHTSLTQTTTAVQIAEFVSYEGRDLIETGGFDHKGESDQRTYVELDGEWFWRENGTDLPVESKGFVGSSIARSNGLVVEHAETSEWGPLSQVGQLIKGAGDDPFRAPGLGEHQHIVLST